MLEQKKISSKINYDVLKDLNVKPAASPVQSPKKEPAPPKTALRQRRPAQAPLTLSTPLSTLGKRWVCQVTNEAVNGPRRRGRSLRLLSWRRSITMSWQFSAQPE